MSILARVAGALGGGSGRNGAGALLLVALAVTLPLTTGTANEPRNYNQSNRTLQGATGNVPKQHASAIRFPLLTVACSPDGRTLAVAGEEKLIKLLDAASGNVIHVLAGHDDMVAQVAFSPDGRTLASAGFDSDVRLWDVASAKSIRVLKGHENWVFGVAFSPDGKTLASAGYDRTARLWDVATGKQLHSLTKHKGGVRAVAFSPDGKRLATAGSDTLARVFDLSTREVLQTLRGHEDAVRSLAFSPDSKRLVTGAEDTTIKLWQVEDGKQLASIGMGNGVRCVAFSPGGTTIASACLDQSMSIHDAANLTRRNHHYGHSAGVTAVAYSPHADAVYSASLDQTIRVYSSQWSAQGSVVTLPSARGQVWVSEFSPDGNWLLTAGADRTLSVRDARLGRQVGEIGGTNTGFFGAINKLVGPTKGYLCVAVSPDNTTLATGNYDNAIRLYDLKSRRLKATITGHKERVWTVAFSPDGKRLVSASGSWDNPTAVGEAKVWDLSNNKVILSLEGLSASVQAVAWSPDGKTIATGCRDGTGRLHDAATGKVRAMFKGHSIDVRNVTFSPGGRWLASSSSDGTVRVWETATGKEQAKLQATSTGANSVAWSADGKWLAASSKPTPQPTPGEVRLWQVDFDEWGVPRFRDKPVLKGHSNHALTVAFSPDSKRLASGGGIYAQLGEVLLWDVAEGRRLATMQGHRRWVECVTFTRDGSTLISAGGTHEDGEVRLWNADAGKGFTVANAHNGEVVCAAWSPDGKTVATGSFDTSIRLWDVASGKPKATLQGHTAGVRALAFSPDGSMLASGGGDRTAKLWDLKTNKPIKELARHQKHITSVAFSPDGRWLATASADPFYKDRTGEVKVIELATGKERTNADWAARPSMSVAFSPDGKFLATGASGPQGLIVYDVQTAKQARIVPGVVSVRALAYSKDGGRIATAHAPGAPRGNGSIQVWETRNWREVTALVGHSAMCLGISFAPDGRTLASASNDATVKLWDLAAAPGNAMAGLTR